MLKKNLQLQNSILFYNGKELFTGKFYINNHIQETTITFKEGKLNGLWDDLVYEPLGTRFKGYYKDGRKDGEWILSSGEFIWQKINFKNGKLTGLYKMWYSNGQLEYKQNYLNGELIDQKCWDKEGNEIKCKKHDPSYLGIEN